MKLDGKGLLQSGIGILIGIILGVGGMTLTRQTQPASIVIEPPPTPGPTPTLGPVRVYVNGSVTNPAVYELPADSIVQDAILAAGGFASNANSALVNLAQPVVDGMQILVPEEGVAAAAPLAPVLSLPGGNSTITLPGASNDGLININTASAEELDKLPGIGPSTAEKIISYRQSNGLFASIDDIKNVSGIGDATFDDIKTLITVGP